jgi:regulator of sigma E protease
MFHPGETVDLVYERDGEKHETTITPKKDEDGNYLIGITSPAQYEKANLLTATQYGVYEVKFWICTTLESLKMLVMGDVGVDQLSGPVGIVSVVDETYQQSKSYGVIIVIMQMLNIGILLSANLGVMNLLPLPALDGGRLVFMIVEAIRGKRVPPDKEGWVHGIGMILLLALMAFVMFNDVKKLF